MRSIMKDKTARFVPFWIFFGVLGILLIGAFITPIRIVLDDIFENIENNAISNGKPELRCTGDQAAWYMKSTCFTLGGFLVMFILYTLYYWVSGMVNGARHPGKIFSAKDPESLLSDRQRALQS